jgi:hypothetical protein
MQFGEFLYVRDDRHLPVFNTPLVHLHWQLGSLWSCPVTLWKDLVHM